MDFFSESYHEAREKFLAAADSFGLRHTRFRIPHEAASDLFVEFAFVKRNPEQLVIHLSGVHGIEGYLGSAVQAAILSEAPPPGQASLLFVHVVNPYGMLLHRRANSENVDLNRNYELARKPNPDYALFDSYLNPKSRLQFVTGLVSGFLAQKKLGKARTTQAVASGQFSHPRGLFYMGQRVQREIAVIQEILRTHFAEVKQAVGIDLHSGLGESGGEMLFVDEDRDPEAPAFFSRVYGRPVSVADPKAGIYINQGRLSNSLRDALPQAKLHYSLQEMGTYSFDKMLNVLRRENFEWHQSGPVLGASEHVKAEMKEAFCPSDPAWREQVLRVGKERWRQACASFQSPEAWR